MGRWAKRLSRRKLGTGAILVVWGLPPEGAYTSKGDRHSAKKIDLAVAAVLAFGRAAVTDQGAFVLI